MFLKGPKSGAVHSNASVVWRAERRPRISVSSFWTPHSDICSVSSYYLVWEGLFITSVCLVLSDASMTGTGQVLFSFLLSLAKNLTCCLKKEMHMERVPFVKTDSSHINLQVPTQSIK